MKELETKLIQAVKAAYNITMETVSIERTEPRFGDFATNIAMQLSKQLGKNPRDIAEEIAVTLRQSGDFLEVAVAGPGFINITLKDADLFKQAMNATAIDTTLGGKVVVMEYSDPNAFKALHAGHLYTTLVGDALSHMVEAAGAKVHRVNFGGDVGLHVGRALWGIIQAIGGEKPEALNAIAKKERAKWINARYVEGNEAYKTDTSAQAEITQLNKRVYELHQEQDTTSPLAQIYWTCRQWSYDGFDELYRELKVHPFDKYYPESTIWKTGLETVKRHIGPVYKESEGAVVFEGEPYGLFTQVFITSQGLPTYAGKDVGLIYEKHKDFAPDVSYIITDVAQKDHMAVVMKSIELFEPELVKNTIHHTHGRIKFADGSKMSSRTGNVVWADDILQATFTAATQRREGVDRDIVLAAVRYSFLKNRIGGDISYDPQESVSLEGNSGPYLQYALVRARGILRNATSQLLQSQSLDSASLDASERSLARTISMFPEAFELALQEYSPHHICSYLYELCQSFNRFYENSRVIDDPRATIRLALVQQYEAVLARGLKLLGIPILEKM